MKRILLFVSLIVFSYSLLIAQDAAVCVDPLEPNNTSSQASDLGTTTSYSNANLCLTPSDEDWLKFSYDGQVYYIVVQGYSGTTEGPYGLRFSRSGANVIIETYATDGDTDTKLYLYTADNLSESIAYDDDGGSGYFSRISHTLVDEDCTDPLEPNNTSSQATNLYTQTSYDNAELCLTPGDEDWLRISYNHQSYYIMIEGYANTTEGAYGLRFSRSGSTITIETYETDGANDTKMHLYTSSFQEIAFDDDGGSGYFSRIVHEFDDGDLCVDPFEPNNHYYYATNLGTTTSYSNANLCITAGDRDWLKFDYNRQTYMILITGYNNYIEGAYGLRLSLSGGTVTIETYETDGSTDTKMYLYKMSLSGSPIQLAENDDGGSGYFSRIVYSLGGCVDPLEPNNMVSQASYIYYDSYNNSDLCLTPGDEDWLRFTYNSQVYYILVKGYSGTTEGAYGLRFTRSDATVTIETYATNGETDTKLYLYAADNLSESIAFDDDGGSGYFSRIVHTISDDDCVDPLEPNNTSSLATNLGTITSYSNANLCLIPDDEDWLKFTYNSQNYYILVKGYASTTEGAYGLRVSRSDANVVIETYVTDGSTDTRLYLYNSSLQQLAYDDDGGSGYFSRISHEIIDDCVDPLEPNDRWGDSYLLPNSTSYNNADLCLLPGDSDWFCINLGRDFNRYFRIMGYNSSTEGAYGLRFSRSGGTITIETYETDGPTDTKIYFGYIDEFDEAIFIPLAFDDDGGSGYFSRLVYTLPGDWDSPDQTEKAGSGSKAYNDIHLDNQDEYGIGEFSIFPNPTEGKFTIRIANYNQDANLILKIMDVTGKILIQKQVHSSGGEFREDFDLSDQPAGMYFIKLRSSDFQKVSKVVVR